MSLRKSTFRKAWIIIIAMVFVSPILGVFLADIVGYHEPLDVAAEKLNLPDLTEDINWTPFLDYTVPYLTPEVGYIVAGLIGVGIIAGIGAVLKEFTKNS
ncbi:MAG: cobalamin biosynthesis protein [Candidatus Bathyarchaeia archaeon]